MLRVRVLRGPELARLWAGRRRCRCFKPSAHSLSLSRSLCLFPILCCLTAMETLKKKGTQHLHTHSLPSSQQGKGGAHNMQRNNKSSFLWDSFFFFLPTTKPLTHSPHTQHTTQQTGIEINVYLLLALAMVSRPGRHVHLLLRPSSFPYFAVVVSPPSLLFSSLIASSGCQMARPTPR